MARSTTGRPAVAAAFPLAAPPVRSLDQLGLDAARVELLEPVHRVLRARQALFESAPADDPLGSHRSPPPRPYPGLAAASPAQGAHAPLVIGPFLPWPGLTGPPRRRAKDSP